MGFYKTHFFVVIPTLEFLYLMFLYFYKQIDHENCLLEKADSVIKFSILEVY